MSSTLDGVMAKINTSNSTMNLYRDFSQNDRITLNSTPCNRNETGSCQGLVSNLTPAHFQAFDFGRVTTQTLAQEENSYNECFDKCIATNPSHHYCHNYCSNEIINDVRKDFV